VGVAPYFGKSSVYVLVDKVDENPLTGGAGASVAFIRPLLSDLVFSKRLKWSVEECR
jgi:hypothetical protein